MANEITSVINEIHTTGDVLLEESSSTSSNNNIKNTLLTQKDICKVSTQGDSAAIENHEEESNTDALSKEPKSITTAATLEANTTPTTEITTTTTPEITVSEATTTTATEDITIAPTATATECEKKETVSEEIPLETKKSPQFKLRIVPLERLLDPSKIREHKNNIANVSPPRVVKPTPIIVLSESEDETPLQPAEKSEPTENKEATPREDQTEVATSIQTNSGLRRSRRLNQNHQKQEKEESVRPLRSSRNLKGRRVLLETSSSSSSSTETQTSKSKSSLTTSRRKTSKRLRPDTTEISKDQFKIRHAVVRLKRISVIENQGVLTYTVDRGFKKPQQSNTKSAKKKTTKQTLKKNSTVRMSSNSESEAEASNMPSTSGGTSNSKRINNDDSEHEVEGKAGSSPVQSKGASSSSSSSSSSARPSSASEQSGSEKEKDNAAASTAKGRDASSSGSEVIVNRKRRVAAKRQTNKEKAAQSSDSDFEPSPKQKKKRRRLKTQQSSDDSDKKSNNDDDDDDEKKKHKRKHIRKIIKAKDLDISTKTATQEEEQRRKRIEERQKLYNQIYDKTESIEVAELVLDFDSETKEALLKVDKGLMKKLKPHQVAGVKFMWDACFETIRDAQDGVGSGCILAHCMGLGKTLQIVTLCHTLLINSRKTNVERALVITPLSTLNNWAREFQYWMNFARRDNIEVYDLSKYKDKQTRVHKLNEWFQEGGVCVLGYDMYRILSNEKAKGVRKKQKEILQKSLVDPGPDLVICDEGHLLKNEKTSISKAVTRMRTKRRIVLTGTPLQNNLKEYYCMIQFVKPNLLGTYKEYLNRFVNPIMNGQYTDSTERDIRLMKHRSHILHKLLEGCIQRRDYSVLAPYLPPKYEYVVYTTLSTVQQEIYEHYMTERRDVTASNDLTGKGARLFQDFQELRRIWTHPMNMRINSDSVIRRKVLNNDNDSMDDFICDNDDEDEDDGTTSQTSIDSSKSFGSGAGSTSTIVRRRAKTRSARRNQANSDKSDKDDSDADDLDGAMEQEDDPSEWWKRFVPDKELNVISHSPKLLILMHLLQQCEAIGDKVLVFSQSLQSLDTIEHFLALIDTKSRGYEYEGDVGDLKGFWVVGQDYFRLDGSCTVEQREMMCKKFNDSKNLRARLFLISTRAGGLGINLVSANRVVIFDVSWNPSHDTQSIFRVYRFGQEKPCYIYRLIAMGTMEQKLYERQVAKQATAKRVIDEQQISRHYNQSDLLELYTYELKPSVPREIPILPKDRLFAELLTEHETILYKYHEHDSLLENEESENLTEAERKAAWSEYEAEKTRTIQTNQYMSYDRNAFGGTGQYGNATGSVTSNKIFGFRTDILLQLLNMKVSKDHPELNQTQVMQLVPTYLQTLYNEMNNGDPTMYKELYSLHATLAHPSGMYMNPLLYVNQNSSAAGYYQSQEVGNGIANVNNATADGTGVNAVQATPINITAAVPSGSMVPPIKAEGTVTTNPTTTANSGSKPLGFEPNRIYEID